MIQKVFELYPEELAAWNVDLNECFHDSNPNLYDIMVQFHKRV